MQLANVDAVDVRHSTGLAANPSGSPMTTSRPRGLSFSAAVIMPAVAARA
jgi:hypothetical protein